MILQPPPPDFSPTMEVSSCFIEYGTRFLSLLRQEWKPQGNTWAVPAGKHEPGERSIDGVVTDAAVRREVKEKIGIILHPERLHFFRTIYVRFLDFDFVYHMFHERFYAQPEVYIDPKDHKDYRWFTPEEYLRADFMEDEDVCVKMFYNI
jgi:8-oxo-dGTP pyrophosphatase MutT (NUDIX family)